MNHQFQTNPERNIRLGVLDVHSPKSDAAMFEIVRGECNRSGAILDLVRHIGTQED